MKKGTKLIAILLAVTLIAGLCIAFTGCNKKDDGKTEIVVFAAASMQETLTELGNKYMAKNQSIKLTFNFDSSGTLRKQIEEGAPCDIFISASQKHMNLLDVTAPADKNPKKQDFVKQGTRFNFLENKVALCVPANNPKNINSWEDLKAAFAQSDFLFCMGNKDVPVGAYTSEILTFLGLNEQELVAAGKITYASNVKEVTTQVTEGTVHCGVIYQTDAFSAGLTPKDIADPDMCKQVIYPAALLKDSTHQTEAQAFIDFLRTEEADQVFTHVGFTPIHAS